MESRHLYKIWDGEKMYNPTSWGWGQGEQLIFYPNGWQLISCLDRIIADGSDGRSLLLQCTGLKDANGKLIWEGDIVTETILLNGSQIDATVSGVVEFVDFHLRWRTFSPRYVGTHLVGKRWGDEQKPKPQRRNTYTHSTAVVGNIYENPELLPE